MTNLRKLLEGLGDAPPLTELEVAERLLVFAGPNSYQVRVHKPGGAIIVCGATGGRRDWVREDYARLFGVEPKHITVSKIRPNWRGHRTKGKRRSQ